MSTLQTTQNIHTLAKGWHDVTVTFNVTKTHAGRYGVTMDNGTEYPTHIGWVVLYKGWWQVYISQDNGGRNQQRIDELPTKAEALDALAWDWANHTTHRGR